MSKKLLALILPAAVLMLVGAGCGGDGTSVLDDVDNALSGVESSTTISATSGTAVGLLDEVDAFAQAQRPGSLPIGVNSWGWGLVIDDYTMPDVSDRDADGDRTYWAYTYVNDESAFDDGTIDNNEAFTIEFQEGKLSLKEVTDTNSTIAIESLTKADWKTDSDKALSLAEGEWQQTWDATPTCQHVDMVLSPAFGLEFGWDITCYETENEGYDAEIDMLTGDSYGSNAVEFEYDAI
ncbi:MAG: hypothetical protein KC925_03985 [Candidatus Doudnabacteria bacterium]|nr:hypothetical protein [Candidatus Doudnabacteria bacterium]